MIPAQEALERLKRGNARFVAEQIERDSGSSRSRRDELLAGQKPFAVILGCSDSRVPAEIVFDQGLGDLFVIRVAGNIVAPSLIGSIEFAVDQFDTRLVVVLGHSECGAVTATLDELSRPTDERSPNLQAIVDRILPAVQHLSPRGAGGAASAGGAAANGPAAGRDELLAAAVRANIHASVEGLRHGSELLEAEIRDHDLRIVGAEYSLGSGLVEFFE